MSVAASRLPTTSGAAPGDQPKSQIPGRFCRSRTKPDSSRTLMNHSSANAAQDIVQKTAFVKERTTGKFASHQGCSLCLVCERVDATSSDFSASRRCASVHSPQPMTSPQAARPDPHTKRFTGNCHSAFQHLFIVPDALRIRLSLHNALSSPS